MAYYPARSLDSIALLMQEQLKAVGIGVTFNCQEDPDATYIANRDFDIALYCMIADQKRRPLLLYRQHPPPGRLFRRGRL